MSYRLFYSLGLMSPMLGLVALLLASYVPGSYAEAVANDSSLSLIKPLRVSFTEFGPYGYTDADGFAKGSIVQVAKRIFEQQQLSYDLRSRPVARIYHQLKVGELDVFLGPVGVPTLQDHVWEVPLPEQYSVTLYLWRKQGTPEVRDVFELQDQSLAVINGFTYRGLIKQIEAPQYGIDLHRTSSHENALRMLVGGRTDYLLDYQLPIEALLPQHPGVKLLRYMIQSRRVALIVSRKGQKGKELHQLLLRATDDYFKGLGNH